MRKPLTLREVSDVHEQLNALAKLKKPKTRKITVRDLSILHQQVNQLAMVNPKFISALARIVDTVFGDFLAAGKVVPTTKWSR